MSLFHRVMWSLMQQPCGGPLRCCRARALGVPLIAVASLLLMAGPVVAQSSADQAELARLQKRVDQLEGQLVDMQVVIGTLESLAQSRGGAPAANGGGARSSSGGADAARIAALETQVAALAAQVSALTGGSGPAVDLRPSTGGGQGNVGLGFGSTTVTPSGQDGRNVITREETRSNGTDLGFSTGGGSPDTAYESAYGALLQQNYAEAQAGFEAFLTDHPRHRLAGNAQYWLGEVYFVQGRYKDAAAAFLRGYQTYGSSSKAPDSLLKLAMSLDRLGERDAACSSFAELSSRFPDAPGYVRNRAEAEQRRLRCQ